MSDLVTAWNKETGEKHPFPVPKHWIDHPTLRPPLSDKPIKKPSDEAGNTAEAKKEGTKHGANAR